MSPRLKFVCNSRVTLSAKRITPRAEILISIRLMTYVSRLRERNETDARNMFPDCRGDFVRASASIRQLSARVFIVGFLAWATIQYRTPARDPDLYGRVESIVKN